MRDWAIDYILNVLEKRDWSANRLASEAGVAASTINRPLRDRDWPHRLSRETIRKIQDASGIDPSPFIPAEMAEDSAIFSSAPKIDTAKILESFGRPIAAGDSASQFGHNEIKIAVVGRVAQIVATIDRDGLTKLRRKLDAIEAMLDD